MLNIILMVFMAALFHNCLSAVTPIEDNQSLLQLEKRAVRNPCLAVYCGIGAYCKQFGRIGICLCRPGFIGSPPKCRLRDARDIHDPKCKGNTDCPAKLACIQEKCTDPCIGKCGKNALCTIENHIAKCTCPIHHTGDPLKECVPLTE